MKISKKISDKIKSLRKYSGWTQSELARRFCITSSSIENMDYCLVGSVLSMNLKKWTKGMRVDKNRHES